MLKKKNMSRREFFKVAGIAGLGPAAISILPFSNSAQAAEKIGVVTIRQDWMHVGYHAPMWVAFDKGWYADNMVSVQILRGFGSGDTAKRIGIGKEPVGQCDAGAVILTLGKGMKQKIVSTFIPTAPYCVVSPKEKGIEKPKDLEGKSIAATAWGGGYIFWPAFAKMTGIDQNSVKVNTVSGELLNAQLLSGKVDGVITYAVGGASLAKAHNKDVNVIMYKDHGLNIISNSITVYTPWLEEKGHETLLKGFLDATYKGIKFSMLNPQEALDILEKYHPESFTTEDEKKYQFELLRTWAALNITKENKENGLGYISEERIKATNDLTFKYKGMDKKVDLNQIYTNKYRPKIMLSDEEWNKVENLYKDYLKLLNL
jgi:NitT/TauT family transport system substrate-binding protein